MNPDIKYEIVMVITMTACFVSGFLFVGWNGEKAVQLMRVELGDRNWMV